MPKRTDANQARLVARYREHGATVSSLHMVGGGVPDLLVGICGITDAVEVKNPAQIPSKRRLTPQEQRWHDEWRGSAVIVETVDDVDLHVAGMRQRGRRLD